MALTRAEARKKIRGELRSLLTHRIKVLTADVVAENYQITLWEHDFEHWRQEIVHKIRRIRYHNTWRFGHTFFEEAVIVSWADDPELVEEAFNAAVADFSRYIKDRAVELGKEPARASKKKLRRLLEATYYERKTVEEIHEAFRQAGGVGTTAEAGTPNQAATGLDQSTSPAGIRSGRRKRLGGTQAGHGKVRDAPPPRISIGAWIVVVPLQSATSHN
jgi:hypothetical protein